MVKRFFLAFSQSICQNTSMRLKFEATTPNFHPLLRFLAVPVMAWFIIAGDDKRLLSFVLFLSIWLTDLLDGYIARRFNQTSDFGKLFDPLVDKIFQLTLAFSMFAIGRLPLWVPLTLAGRELMMIAGSAMIYRKNEQVVYAKWHGKITTVLFVIAFAALFWIPNEPDWLAGAIFVPPILWSFVSYVVYGLAYIKLWKVKHDR